MPDKTDNNSNDTDKIRRFMVYKITSLLPKTLYLIHLFGTIIMSTINTLYNAIIYSFILKKFSHLIAKLPFIQHLRSRGSETDFQ